MDGDFAPLLELVELRKKHGFLLAIDDVSPYDILTLTFFFLVGSKIPEIALLFPLSCTENFEEKRVVWAFFVRVHRISYLF